MGRKALYASALMKVALCQRRSPAEARELRRRRLADGSFPMPMKADAVAALPFRFADPRLVRAR